MNLNTQSAFTTKKQLKMPVKVSGISASRSGFLPFFKLQHTRKNSQSPGLSFSIFCQINLTKLHLWVENIDNSSPLQKMEKGKGAALGAMMLGALSIDPALAEDRKNPDVHLAAATTTEQVTDCVAFVKGQRDLAKENGIVMTRKDQKLMLLDCQGDQLDARIAEQNRVIAAFDEELRKIGLSVDGKGQIRDEHNRAIAQIISINGQWVIQRKLETEMASSETGIAASEARIDASRERQEQMLQEAKRILQRLATS